MCKEQVTNRQLRDRVKIAKLNLHKPTVNLSVCIDEYGNREFKVASVTYPNEEHR